MSVILVFAMTVYEVSEVPKSIHKSAFVTIEGGIRYHPFYHYWLTPHAIIAGNKIYCAIQKSQSQPVVHAAPFAYFFSSFDSRKQKHQKIGAFTAACGSKRYIQLFKNKILLQVVFQIAEPQVPPLIIDRAWKTDIAIVPHHELCRNIKLGCIRLLELSGYDKGLYSRT